MINKLIRDRHAGHGHREHLLTLTSRESMKAELYGSVSDDDGSNVLKPAARLDEARQLGRQCARVEITDDKDPHGVSAGGLVDFRDQLIALRDVESIEHTLRELIYFGI
jgi:hypothetical protein